MTNVDRLETDVAIIGGGPAGLSAAHAAAELGASTVLLDQFARTGGQYHMQSGVADAKLAQSRQVRDGIELADKAVAAGADIRTSAEVFWAERQASGFTVYGARGDNALVVNARALVVATGAMERPIPFEGWTLPGVMTAGAAQRLIKTSGVPPGKRVVLAGSGPFLLAVASTFAAAGLPISHYVEAARPAVAGLALLARHPGRAAEALRLARGLLRTGATRHFGWAVQEAVGRDRVDAVRICPVTSDGRFDTTGSILIEDVDALCVGYGFKPIIDLTALLQADHRYDPHGGGWICSVALDTGATSVPGLFAAGETTRVSGAIAARLSGRLAGRHGALHAGFGDAAAIREPDTAAALGHARHFAAGLASVFPFQAGLLRSLPPEEIVCRCEDVRRQEIDAAIADGAVDVASVKRWTRAGMGPCQGRICGSTVADLLAVGRNVGPEQAGFNRPHLPLRPVGLTVVEAAFAEASDEERS